MNIQLADILSTIRFNQGHMPTHELAMMLGKQHTNLLRKLESQGVLLFKLKTLQIEKSAGNNGSRLYTSYLLDERQAVALAMSYDMQLGMMVWDAFKAALEVVDAVNAGEDPETIAKKAEDAAYEALSSSVKHLVCPTSKITTKKLKELMALCVRVAAVEIGGVHSALSSITEFHKAFAIQAELRGLPLRSHWSKEAQRIINPAFGIEEDSKRARLAFDNNFSSWE
ncbi:hypothetical protein [Aeromonas veronii]|uniref:hypothetical protein n=1 Tax=Aeromonas veronii TaxID=654 RepID=UPI00341B21F2